MSRVCRVSINQKLELTNKMYWLNEIIFINVNCRNTDEFINTIQYTQNSKSQSLYKRKCCMFVFIYW